MPIRKYLLTGLMVWLPLAITIWVLMQLIGALDSVMGGLLSGLAAVTPASMAPGWMQLRNIPGLGVIMVAAILLVTGALGLLERRRLNANTAA